EYCEAPGLKGRTLGIVGMGGIGTEVARRAQGFEMPVVAWSRSLTPQRAAELGVTRVDSVQAVAAECDILTVHVALTPETKGLMPNGVSLCARSPAKRMLIMRHRNRPGVFAHVLGEIGRAHIYVEEMENTIFSDAQAACAKIRLDDAPDSGVLVRIQAGCEHI